MKVLDIALKDLVRAFRATFLLVFMFVLPVLTTGLFYFAFGGGASFGGDDGFHLPVTKVQVANLDQADSGLWAGQMLVDILYGEELSDWLQVTEAADASIARSAVNAQHASVAIIIPANLTAAILEGGSATIELYQDPTLTLGPNIVKTILMGVIDGFAGSRIMVDVARDQLAQQGITVDPSLWGEIGVEYGRWMTSLGSDQQERTGSLLDVRSPGGTEAEPAGGMVVSIIGMVMASMMVFYVFFTGAASAQTILAEEEAGMLPRLFTTPTPQSVILGGKFIATFLTLFVQIAVLLLFSALVFGIRWGDLLPVTLMILGVVVVAASFGIFITSLLKNTKQTGIVFGGVMSVMGMLGMFPLFTAGSPGNSQIANIALITPQGWAINGWQLLLEGGGVEDILPTVAVLLGLGIIFFVLGVLRFRKRFA